MEIRNFILNSEKELDSSDEVELILLNLFNDKKEKNKIISSFGKLSKIIEEEHSMNGFIDLFNEYDIFEQLFTIFDEDGDEAFRAAILTFINTIARYSPLDILHIFTDFCVSSLPELPYCNYFVPIITTISQKSRESHNYVINSLKEETFHIIAEASYDMNCSSLCLFLTSLLKFEVPNDFLFFVLSDFIPKTKYCDELIVTAVSVSSSVIEILGKEVIKESAEKMIRKGVIDKSVILSVACTSCLWDNEIVPLLFSVAQQLDEKSAISLTALSQIAQENEEICSFIKDGFDTSLFVDAPGLITREAARLFVTIIQKLPLSETRNILNSDSLSLLFCALIFEDTELRRSILKAILLFDKEEVQSNIDEEIADLIQEAVDECGFEEALELIK